MGTALRRAAVAVAALLLSGGIVAADVILLRDGSQKRGALSTCDPNSCRIGAESVARTSIEWIGLDRDTPAPAVRNPERDELHLANSSVQSVTLTGVDSGSVYATFGGQGFAAASSLPRRSVAWIHLGRPRQGATERAPDEAPTVTKPPAKTGDADTTGNQARQDRSTRSDGAPWRLPSHIYTWMPPNCPTCDVSLSVIDLRVQGEDVMIVKSRVITVGTNHLSASWLTFNPPLPLFPATTDVARFLFKGKGKTAIALDFYHQGHSGTGAAGGGAPATPAASPNSPCVPVPDTSVNQGDVQGPPTAPPDLGGRPISPDTRCAPGTGPSPYSTEREEDQLARSIGQSMGIPDVWASRLAEAWRDRMAQDSAAAQGQGPAAPGGAQYRQHTRQTGEVTYHYEVQIWNWPVYAGEIVRPGGAGLEQWQKLTKIPIYDVWLRLELEWANVSGQTRRVDHQGYTTDDSWQRGPHGPAPGPRQYAPRPEYAPYVAEEPERQRGRVEEFLYGDPLQPVREAARERAAREWEGAMRGIGDMMSGDFSGPVAARSTGPTGMVIDAVNLRMRWSRADGRVSAHHGTDIFRSIDGRPEPVRWIVSGTRPQHAFDLSGAPPWTPPNPKPPPPPDNSGGSWLRR